MRLFGWIVGLAAAGALLLVLGRGALTAPNLRDPGSWSSWAQARTAPEASMAVVRLVALGLTVYLLAVTLLAVAVRVGDVGRELTVLDVVTLPFVRAIVQAGLGAGLVGAAVAGVAARPPSTPAPTRADAAIVAADPSTPPAIEVPPAPVPEPVTPAPPVTTATWTVAPGDHLWSIAARAVASSLGRAPSDAEVAPYWRSLIDANRSVLADPDNPDLLFSGQVLTLPQ
jgi:hypothetical protein